MPCVHHPINFESPDAWWVNLIGRFKSTRPSEAPEMDSDGTCLSIWERRVCRWRRLSAAITGSNDFPRSSHCAVNTDGASKGQ